VITRSNTARLLSIGPSGHHAERLASTPATGPGRRSLSEAHRPGGLILVTSVPCFRKNFAHFFTQTHELTTKKQAKFVYSMSGCLLDLQVPGAVPKMIQGDAELIQRS
jgi:hypothetical protein